MCFSAALMPEETLPLRPAWLWPLDALKRLLPPVRYRSQKVQRLGCGIDLIIVSLVREADELTHPFS